MALSQRLEFRQSQSLVMTPQLMQAIKLLQLSNLDLVAYVEGELEKNPLLERESDGGSESEQERREPVAAQPGEGDGQAGDYIDQNLETSRSAMEDRLGTDLDNVFPDDAPPPSLLPSQQDQPAGYSEWASTGSGGRDDSDYNLEAFVSAETTLADHLAEQLALAISEPARRMIGQYLIDMVDEAGYLVGDLASVAEKLGAPMPEVEAVLGIVQGFDPPGVCARNLTECLSIQLRERDRFDPAMQALVSRLDLLAKRDLAALRRICGVGDEDLTEMIAEIRNLNPKPGLAFGSTMVQPIVPDVFVRPGPDGSFLV
jgi:RNA polymerase sigma-54 factor